MERRGFLKGLLTGIAAAVGGAKIAQASDVVPMKCVALRAPEADPMWVDHSGRYVFNVPEGVTGFYVTCYGGGGGGGNGERLILSEESLRIRPGESIAITIGA